MRPLTMAALVGLTMLVCMAVGWITVQMPRRARPGVAQKPPPAQETKDPEPPAEDPKPVQTLSYDRDVQPIMQRACAGCHGRMRKRGGVDLSTLAAVRRGGDNGPILKPGKPDDSAIYESITAGRMPPKMPEAVTPAERRLIRDWIAAGAK